MHAADDSRIRKGFRAISQFPATIIQVMMGNRKLKTVYHSLVTTSIVTIIASIFLLGTTLTTTGITVTVGVYTAIAAVLVHLLPFRYGIAAVGAGVTLFAAQFFVPAIQIPHEGALSTGIIAAVLTLLALAYLTKHAIIIGALVWDKEMAGEIPDPDNPGTNDEGTPDDGDPESNTDQFA